MSVDWPSLAGFAVSVRLVAGGIEMNAEKVITHRTLLQAVWGPQYTSEDQHLYVLIGNLRRKIEQNASRPHYLRTEAGIGYRLRVE